MWKDFRDFLTKQNALALAIGVIIGSAVGKVVASLVSDLLMPVISLGIPSGEWRSAKVIFSQTVGADGKPIINSFNYGSFLGTTVDFAIIALVVFVITRIAFKPAAVPPTKVCPFCLEAVPVAATKCRACTSPLEAPSTATSPHPG